MPYPKTLEAKPKIIFFTDFDGTITLKDSNDWMVGDDGGFEHACSADPFNGPTTSVLARNRKANNLDVLHGKVSFRNSFRDMMDSVKQPFPECISLLCANIKLDPYFKEFYEWSRQVGVPVIVLSSGMTPIIRALLVHLIGPQGNDIEIVSNEVVDRPPKRKEEEGGWQIQYHDGSDFGHDKSLTIRPYAKHFDRHPHDSRPVMLYAGDGVSDLSAARETDLLFAKKGYDLVSYCEREGVPFTVFEDWQSIMATTQAIFEGKATVKDVAAESAEKAKQANDAVATVK